MRSIEITDVRVKFNNSPDGKLLGYCALTLNNAIVIKDIKVIRGDEGIFVAMPSRKLTNHCPQCSGKNHIRANYCNDCGAQLSPNQAKGSTRERLHFDIVHPINADVRAMVQAAIVAEVERLGEGNNDPKK